MRDDDLAGRIEEDYTTAGLTDKRLGMLDFAVKLTTSPAATVESDVERLRHLGFEDIDILHIVEVVSYYAYANRVADGLGIALEDWIPED